MVSKSRMWSHLASAVMQHYWSLTLLQNQKRIPAQTVHAFSFEVDHSFHSKRLAIPCALHPVISEQSIIPQVGGKNAGKFLIICAHSPSHEIRRDRRHQKIFQAKDQRSFKTQVSSGNQTICFFALLGMFLFTDTRLLVQHSLMVCPWARSD